MKRAPRLLTLALVIAAGTVLPGGCPLTPTQLEPLLPLPGTYWVAEQNGKLYYFQLSQQRDDPNQWFPLEDDAEWFEGPGFYSLNDDFTWSPDENFAGLTLDEVIQLHDPPPEVPQDSP